MRDFRRIYCESQKALNGLIDFDMSIVQAPNICERKAQKEKQTKSVYHLSGMVWTNGTALFFSKEMNRIEPYHSRYPRAGVWTTTKMAAELIVLLDVSGEDGLAETSHLFSALIKVRISNMNAKEIWKRSKLISFSPVLLQRCYKRKSRSRVLPFIHR